LACRSTLGGAYVHAGRAIEAVSVLKRASAASERVLGPDSRLTLNTRGSLARAYAATRRWQKATVLYRRVLADYERTLGPDHSMTRQYRDIVAQLPPWWLRALAPVLRVTRRWRRAPRTLIGTQFRTLRERRTR